MQVPSETLPRQTFQPKAQGFAQKLILCVGVFAMVLSVAPAVIYTRNPDAKPALVSALVLAAAGAANLFAAHRKAQRQAATRTTYTINADGLFRQSATGSVLFRWDDIAYVYFNDSPPARAIPALQVVRILTQTGDELLIDQTTEGHYALGEKVADAVCQHHFPVAMHGLRLGQDIVFGHLRLNKSGIRHQERFVEWPNVQSASVNYVHSLRANCLEVSARDNTKQLWCQVPLHEVPNSLLLRALLKDGTAAPKTNPYTGQNTPGKSLRA